MSYSMVNGRLVGPDGVSFPYDERDPRFAAFKDYLEAGGEVLAGEASPVPASIHKAWFRAALADMGHIASVDAAVQQAGPVKWELWANATSIDRTDADVVAIASALNIDLDAVFVRAKQLQDERQP